MHGKLFDGQVVVERRFNYMNGAQIGREFRARNLGKRHVCLTVFDDGSSGLKYLFRRGGKTDLEPDSSWERLGGARLANVWINQAGKVQHSGGRFKFRFQVAADETCSGRTVASTAPEPKPVARPAPVSNLTARTLLERVPVGTKIKIMRNISVPAWNMYISIHRTALGDENIPARWAIKVKSTEKDRYIKKGLVLTVAGADLEQTCNNASDIGGRNPVYRIKVYVDHPKIDYIRYESGFLDKDLDECVWHTAVAGYMMNSRRSGFYFDMY